jgi:thiol:disulfide interchange protein DsbD
MGKQLMSRKNLAVFFLAALVTRAAALAQTYEGVELVHPALIADATAVLPGQKFTAGLHLRMAPGWHTYWQYPGDSGLAPKIEWNLPPGFSAGAIQWPLPGKIVEPGDIVTYGYKDEMLLLVEISAPQQIAAREITLKAKASWLVCEQICIPGSAQLSLTLPVASANAAANRRLFEKYRALLPKVGLSPPFHYQWKSKPGLAVLEITGVKSGNLDFFPLPPAESSIEHPQIDGGEIRIPVTTGAPDQLSGVLVLGEGSEGWFIASASSSAPSTASSGGVSISGLKGTTRDLLRNLFFGFLGGFILNLMPCVLPVIALKIFGFIQQAGQSQAKIFRLGLAFIAGIFVWFLGLAALVVGFKAAGHELNWAFQFQSPWFLAVMALIVLVFALNLLGVFEVVLPAGANAQLLDIVSHEGYRGAFLHGMFATLLATPCTAPFLGPALGFAFAQPPALVFAMFASIAAGMSLPYFLLTARPAWLRLLPKPGMWMVRVKQCMGLLLLGTVVWLVWVLFQQQHGAAREPFVPQLEAALRKGRTVFVDFTADWCVNCKVNERLVLNSDTVRKAFKEQNVIFLKADWTNGDPKITALLREFGRAGVPLYVIYPAGAVDAPIVLPELITPQIVLDGLARATKATR